MTRAMCAGQFGTRSVSPLSHDEIGAPTVVGCEKRREDERCGGSWLAVTAAVVGQLRELGRCDCALVTRKIQAARDDALSRCPEVDAERGRLESRLAELRRERQNLLDAIAQGVRRGGSSR